MTHCGYVGENVVRGDIANLNRIDPLLGEDIRDDDDLVSNLKILAVLQNPERRL